MIRSSSLHRICTNRPFFDLVNFNAMEDDLAAKVEKKKMEYYRADLPKYIDTAGLITAAKAFARQIELKEEFELNALPEGAKTYMKEIWLEQNYNFHDFSLLEGNFQLRKGTIAEDAAIEVLSEYFGQPFTKNENRVTKGFLSGECDIDHERIIRDVKCPESWKTFQSKAGISSTYHWQLIGYCYLYDCREAYLDYVLMPTPHELIEKLFRGYSDREQAKFLETDQTIEELTLEQRIKTYKVEKNIGTEIQFMVERLRKAEEYYNTLTYDECMNKEPETESHEHSNW